jgi:hypothetical protein
MEGIMPKNLSVTDEISTNGLDPISIPIPHHAIKKNTDELDIGKFVHDLIEADDNAKHSCLSGFDSIAMRHIIIYRTLGDTVVEIGEGESLGRFKWKFKTLAELKEALSKTWNEKNVKWLILTRPDEGLGRRDLTDREVKSKGNGSLCQKLMETRNFLIAIKMLQEGGINV